jgi:hypothetical protein
MWHMLFIYGLVPIQVQHARLSLSLTLSLSLLLSLSPSSLSHTNRDHTTCPQMLAHRLTGMSRRAYLVIGVEEPVQGDLNSKQHQQRPKEEVRHVLDHRHRQQKQSNLRTCPQAQSQAIRLRSHKGTQPGGLPGSQAESTKFRAAREVTCIKHRKSETLKQSIKCLSQQEHILPFARDGNKPAGGVRGNEEEQDQEG